MRLAFDRFEIPFDLIHKDHVQPGARLRAKYDVIVVPHQTQSGKALVYEQPKLSKPLPYSINDTFKTFGMYAETDDVRGGMGIKGVAEFAEFVEAGGVLMTFGVASYFPAEFGLTRSVDAQRPQGTWYAPGPYVQAEAVDAGHPLLYGARGKTLPVRWADGPLLQVAGSNPELVAFTGTTPNTAKVVLRFPGGDGRGAERPDARRRPAAQPSGPGGRAGGQGPRAALRDEPDLPLADLRRALPGLQRPALLERHRRAAGAAPDSGSRGLGRLSRARSVVARRSGSRVARLVATAAQARVAVSTTCGSAIVRRATVAALAREGNLHRSARPTGRTRGRRRG